MRKPRRFVIAAWFVIGTALAAQQAVAPVEQAQPTPPAQHVKGWRGAQWGMTPEQVATALNQPLGELTQNPQEFIAVWHSTLRAVKVGPWLADVELTFKPRTRLVSVVIGFSEPPGFTEVRNELVGTYGPPTSEKRERSPSLSPLSSLTEEARWVLPNTEITCQRIAFPRLEESEPSGKVFFHVTLSERVRAF